MLQNQTVKMQDAWTCIIDQCTSLERAMLNCCCKSFCATPKTRKLNTLQLAVENEDIPLIRYCLLQGYKMEHMHILAELADFIEYLSLDEEETFNYAVKSQDLSFVQQLLSLGASYNEDALGYASALPSLEIFEFLYKELFNKDPRYLRRCYKYIFQAKEIDRIERFEYLVSLGGLAPKLSQFREYAICNFALFQHLRQKYNFVVREGMLFNAVNKGDKEVVRYILDNTNVTQREYITTEAVFHPPIFKLLVERGWVVDNYTSNIIITRKDFELIDFLKELGIALPNPPGRDEYLPLAKYLNCKPDKKMYAEALASNSKEMLQWILANSYEDLTSHWIIHMAFFYDNMPLLRKYEHLASKRHPDVTVRSIDACKWLLRRYRNLYGDDILTDALQNKNKELQDWLISQGYGILIRHVLTALCIRDWDFIERYNLDVTNKYYRQFCSYCNLEAYKRFIKDAKDRSLYPLISRGKYSIVKYVLEQGGQLTEDDKRDARQSSRYLALNM